ncbi:hypothetical protein KIN20_015554 [Parelaphostrongylus tenuis]|uniref:Uncharacterized protein n=1 Tax=Parelaphostrongylus tenuis TaxID=148309 RepID=A0AAD5MYN3_PARTN|nr:hypothetical protein KIN20_015554 [Parelaphostrongylus tenuis]
METLMIFEQVVLGNINVLRCSPAIDAMAIVYREKDVFPFFKYVNHLAGSDPLPTSTTEVREAKGRELQRTNWFSMKAGSGQNEQVVKDSSHQMNSN